MFVIVQNINENGLGGAFDIAVLEGDVNSEENKRKRLISLVYSAFFTEAAAQDAPADKRGWWAEPDRGSLLWWARRKGLNANTRALILNNLKNALSAESAKEGGAFTDIKITDDTPAGNVSLMAVKVAARYDNALLDVTIHL